MISLLLLLACRPSPDCSLTSTVPDFTPDCDGAVLYRYTGESRLVVAGAGGTLVAWLPEDLEPFEYGGTSGNPLVVTLDLGDGDRELVARARTTTLTFAEIDDEQADARLHADFDDGVVAGPVAASVALEYQCHRGAAPRSRVIRCPSGYSRSPSPLSIRSTCRPSLARLGSGVRARLSSPTCLTSCARPCT